MKKVFYFFSLSLLIAGLTACGAGTTTSNKFTSEDDVCSYLSGKTFTIPWCGITSQNFRVESYTDSTAIVKVYFDLSEALGRCVTEHLKYEVNKNTGECTIIY